MGPSDTLKARIDLIISATHDRGHAGPEPLCKHPKHLPPASLALRATLQQVIRTAGTRADPGLSGLSDERKELVTGSILIAIAALRFLYKVTLKRNWSLAEVIPDPKKPQKLCGPESGGGPSVLGLRQEPETSRCLDQLLCSRPTHLRGRCAHTSHDRQ